MRSIIYDIFEAENIYDVHKIGIWAESNMEQWIEKIPGVLSVKSNSNYSDDEEKCYPNYYQLRVDPRYVPIRICKQIRQLVKEK